VTGRSGHGGKHDGLGTIDRHLIGECPMRVRTRSKTLTNGNSSSTLKTLKKIEKSPTATGTSGKVSCPSTGLNESQRPVSRLDSAEQACIEQAAAVVLTAAVTGRLQLVAGRLGAGGKEAGVENSFVAADAEETALAPALIPAPCVAAACVAARVATARVATGAATEGGVVPAAGASGSAGGRVVAARIRGSGRGTGPACLRMGGVGAGRDACEGAMRYDGCGVIE
jgi:hypothetical protein